MTKWSIETLLGLDVEQFAAQNALAERFLKSQALTSDLLANIITLRDVDTVIASQAMCPPMVRVNKDGERLRLEAYTVPCGSGQDAGRYVDTLRLFRCFRDGASIVLRDMHRYWSPLTKLSWDLSRELGFAVTVNGYLAPPNVQALPPHFDYHDIVVIQISGTKEWLTYHANSRLPLDNNSWRHVGETVDPRVPGPNATPSGAIRLSRGDVLYIPRGSSHTTMSGPGVSFHLTLALQEVTYFDVASSVLSLVRESTELRGALPMDREDRTSLANAVLARASSAFLELADVVGGTGALDAKVFHDSHSDLYETPVALTAQYGCLHELGDDVELTRRENLLYVLQCGEADVTLQLRDRSIKFPPAAKPLLDYLLSGKSITPRSARAYLANTEAVRQVISILVTEAILGLRVPA